MMKIDDLPRPWFLAAVTGVPMSDLLTRAAQEQSEEKPPDAYREEARERARPWPPGERKQSGAASRVQAETLSLAS